MFFLRYIIGINFGDGVFFLHRVKATWDSEGARNMYRMLRDATVGPSSSKSIDIFEDNDPEWKKDEGWKRGVG